MKAVWIPVIAACTLAALDGASGAPDPKTVVLAEMDGYTITLDEYLLSVLIERRIGAEDIPYDERVVHLDRMVDRALSYLEATANGYTFDLDENTVERARRKALVLELFRDYGRPDTILIDEEVLRSDYEHLDSEVRIRAVMVASRGEAREILDLVRGGSDLADLARSRGEGAESNLGGDLGWQGWWSLENVPEIREAAYGMKIGEVSGVIETEYGYHVIRLEDRRSVERAPYDQIRNEIFWRRRRPKVEGLMTAFRRSIEDSLNVVVNPDALGLLVEKLDAAGAVGSPDRVEDFLTESDRGRTLVTSRAGGFTLGEFLGYQEFTERRFPSGGVLEIGRFIRRRAMDDLLVRVAQDRNLENTEGFRLRMKIYEQMNVGAAYKRDHVYPRARVTPAMAEEYYHTHRDEFVTPPEAHLRRIVVENKAAADSILGALAAGADFEALARKRSLEPGAAETGGDMGYIARGRFGGLLDELTFELKAGETSEPFVWFGQWNVVQLLDKRAPRVIPLDEATSSIVRQLEPTTRIEINSEWMDGLKEKYNLVVQLDVLRDLS